MFRSMPAIFSIEATCPSTVRRSTFSVPILTDNGSTASIPLLSTSLVTTSNSPSLGTSTPATLAAVASSLPNALTVKSNPLPSTGSRIEPLIVVSIPARLPSRSTVQSSSETNIADVGPSMPVITIGISSKAASRLKFIGVSELSAVNIKAESVKRCFTPFLASFSRISMSLIWTSLKIGSAIFTSPPCRSSWLSSTSASAVLDLKSVLRCPSGPVSTMARTLFKRK